MTWIRRTFSDGRKPSLARQLLALLVAAICAALVLGRPIPDVIGEISWGLAAWAGASRWASAKTTGGEHDAAA